MELEPLIEDYFEDVIQTQRRTRDDMQDLITLSLLSALAIRNKETESLTLINHLAQILNQQLLIIASLNRHPGEVEFSPPGGTVGKKGRTTFLSVLAPQLQYYMERRAIPPNPKYIETMCDYARQNIEIVQFIPMRSDPIYRDITLEKILDEAQHLIDYM
jgi:hypothetical protein